MEYRRLGNTGLQVSALSLGSWVTFKNQVNDDLAEACMTAAFKAGVNFFDNAEAYAAGEAESMMGRVLQRVGWSRQDLVISTKLFWGGDGPNRRGLSRKRIRDGLNASLQRMQLDYVDLLFCHRPDPDTPVEETVRAMNWAIDQGYALYWGTSEWSKVQLDAAYEVSDRLGLIGPSMEQPQYNMFWRERVETELAPLYESRGLGTTIWSPLASGFLTGKYLEGIEDGTRMSLASMSWLRERYEDPAYRWRFDAVRQLAPIAESLDCSLAQLALAWCLRVPYVSTVITGASSVKQVEENMKAMAVVERLTPDVLAKIDTLLTALAPAPD